MNDICSEDYGNAMVYLESRDMSVKAHTLMIEMSGQCPWCGVVSDPAELTEDELRLLTALDESLYYLNRAIQRVPDAWVTGRHRHAVVDLQQARDTVWRLIGQLTPDRID